jgi:methionyl-tRNA synthetase
MNKYFYITTAIDYVNGQPHLGHAYEKVITDVIARSHRSMGQDVFFLTGNDEHGQKVQQAALAMGKDPQDYCDELSQIWKDFVASLDISNNDYIRTTEPRHKSVVQIILNKLYQNGHFYKAAYRGFYSTKEETFLTEKDRRPDGTFDPAYGEVIELEEENYYFRLQTHQQWLLQHIEEHPEFIQPDYRRNEVLGFLKNNVLEDLCISRPVTRLNWGIPLPFDLNYVTYVWFDALSNYVTAPASHGDPVVVNGLGLKHETGEQLDLWPADIHVIGKDILKFHTVYWPIMLKAMGLPLPKQVLVHGWWQKDGQKMSKSTGNVVDPIAVIREWGVDAFRFYIVRELPVGADGNWTDSGFRMRYTADLANGIGNLVNRSLTMLIRYRQGRVPKPSTELEPEVRKTVTEVISLLQQNDLYHGLLEILALVTRVNQYVDYTAPFKLAKDPAKSNRLDEVLYNLIEVCRILAILLFPFLPQTANKIYLQLGLDTKPDSFSKAKWGGLQEGHLIGKPEPLFPRKD